MASWKKIKKIIAYDHIFYGSVRHAYIHVTTPLIPCGPPSVGEKSTHTTWHALHKGHHSSWANCTPRLAQWKSGGSIHVSEPDPGLVPNLLNEVHVWTLSWPALDTTSCFARKAIVSRAVWGVAFFWAYTKLDLKTPVAHGSIPS